MRRALFAVATVVLAAVAVAAPAEVADDWWGVRIELPAIVARPCIAPPGQIVVGHAGDIDVEVFLTEQAEARPAERVAAYLDSRSQRRRPMGAIVRDAAAGVVLLTDRGMGNILVRHAYRFVVRGEQTFTAHARATLPVSDDALRAAVGAVCVDPDGHGCLGALRVVEQMAVDRKDPRAAAYAAQWYASDERNLPHLAARQAEFALAADDLVPEEKWSLAMGVGLVFLADRTHDQARTWLERARKLADAVTDRPDAVTLTLYNLACAHAVRGDPDLAFAALQELVDRGGWQAQAAWAQKDADLESLRKDPRWKNLPAPD